MSYSLAAALLRRQNDDDEAPDGWVIDDDGISWWYSKTGQIVKWSVAFGLIAAIGLYLLLSYLHAQRRLKKGLTPLRYHRWMVSRREMARVDPSYAYPQATYAPYPPPPPAYYNMQPMAPPPVYEPPAKGEFAQQSGVQPKQYGQDQGAPPLARFA